MSQSDLVEELEKLAKLRSDGVLSEDEFSSAKAAVLERKAGRRREKKASLPEVATNALEPDPRKRKWSVALSVAIFSALLLAVLYVCYTAYHAGLLAVVEPPASGKPSNDASPDRTALIVRAGKLVCAKALAASKDIGIVPNYAQLADPLPHATNVTGRYVCTSRTTVATYNMAVDLVCKQLRGPRCVLLYSISEPDGALLYQRPKPQPETGSPGITIARNENDPYGDEQADSALARYLAQRSESMRAIKTLYFALGCKVFSTEADMWGAVANEELNLRNAMIADGISDPKAEIDVGGARHSGLEKAKNDAACQYWHEHPDAVGEIRKMVSLAE